EPTKGYEDAIVVPAIIADNFKLKHGLLTIVQNKQFYGHDKEDPHAHILYFNKITSTLKFPNIPNTSIVGNKMLQGIPTASYDDPTTKVQKKSESNSQNMAFISSSNTSSGKGKVYTAIVQNASIQVSTASTDVVAASLSHDTVYAYIATQSNGSQIKYQDITHIDEDDIKEMDIKWNMALLSMRADRFWKKTECRAPRSQDIAKRESYKQGPKEEELAPKELMAIDGIG
nr:reverse transcriptase domain-containing protein [Tanacetum cinerariifolium]GEZ89931.1 reverse transcriptase domain-containing protein [Tanacetum cinerariifolium]